MARSLDWMLASLLIIPAAAQAQMAPGEWETTATVKSVDMPGAPPQVAQMLKSQMAANGTHTTSYCLTPEQASKGPQEMLKQNASCHFTQFSMSGGTISTEMTCAQNGGTMTARSSGSYTPSSFNMTSTATMTGRMSMRMTTVSSGRRMGPCTRK